MTLSTTSIPRSLLTGSHLVFDCGEEFHQWIEEAVPTAAMGDRQNITAYRYWKGTPGPWDIAQRNRDSLWRNTNDVLQKFRRGPAGQTGVPEEVRDVISSPGQSLDSSIQETVEERLGDSLGDVRIHTGPRAAEAAEAINARAFTVGNHIAFNHGEYDPESAEGQHVLAHELAHVRQQAKGGIQRLTADSEVEIGNPESQYEHEATAVAKEIVDPTSERTTRLTPSPLAVLRTEEDTYFDHVIEAIKAESDLDEEDIARIKREAAEEVEGTDYEGARGHDELNIKILEKAEEKIREKREVIEEKSEVEAELDEAKVDAVTGAAAAEQGNEDVEVAEGVPAAEAADREQALTDRQEELLEEVEELEAELDSLLSEENLRLTDAQQQELQSVADRVASIIGGPVGDVVATFIASLTVDQAVGMSLGSIVMTAIGVSQAPAAVVVTTVLLAITTGLSMLVGRFGGKDEEDVVPTGTKRF